MKHVLSFDQFVAESISEMAASDVNVQRVLKAFDSGNTAEKERITDAVAGKKHTDRNRLIKDLSKIGYSDIKEIMSELGIKED